MTKVKDAEGRKDCGKRYKIDARSIVENHNPRNPLGTNVRKDYTLFTGTDNDLWSFATSDDGAHRALFTQILEELDPYFVAWAETIRQVGLVEPIEVRDNGAKDSRGNTYTLIFGCRRVLAILYIWCKTGGSGTPWVEAQLSPKINASGLLHRSIVENIRSDPSPVEKARALQMALNMGEEVADLARIYGCCEQTIRNTLKLLELPPDVLKKIELGQLKPSKALKQAQETRSPDRQLRSRSKLPKALSGALEPLRQGLRNVTPITEDQPGNETVLVPLTREQAHWLLQMMSE